jgi:Flp pilus assembly protein TadD
MRELASLLERAGRTDEATAVWQPAADNGDTTAMRALALLLSKVGQPGLAEGWLRLAVQLGDGESLTALAGLLRVVGRTDEARRVTNFGLEPDGRTAAERA